MSGMDSFIVSGLVGKGVAQSRQQQRSDRQAILRHHCHPILRAYLNNADSTAPYRHLMVDAITSLGNKFEQFAKKTSRVKGAGATSSKKRAPLRGDDKRAEGCGTSQPLAQKECGFYSLWDVGYLLVEQEQRPLTMIDSLPGLVYLGEGQLSRLADHFAVADVVKSDVIFSASNPPQFVEFYMGLVKQEGGLFIGIGCDDISKTMGLVKQEGGLFIGIGCDDISKTMGKIIEATSLLNFYEPPNDGYLLLTNVKEEHRRLAEFWPSTDVEEMNLWASIGVEYGLVPAHRKLAAIWPACRAMLIALPPSIRQIDYPQVDNLEIDYYARYGSAAQQDALDNEADDAEARRDAKDQSVDLGRGKRRKDTK